MPEESRKCKNPSTATVGLLILRVGVLILRAAYFMVLEVEHESKVQEGGDCEGQTHVAQQLLALNPDFKYPVPALKCRITEYKSIKISLKCPKSQICSD